MKILRVFSLFYIFETNANRGNVNFDLKNHEKKISVRRYRRSGNFYNPDFFATEADKDEILKVWEYLNKKISDSEPSRIKHLLKKCSNVI